MANAHQLINSLTYQLINLSTYQLFNSSTFQFINLLTRLLVNRITILGFVLSPLHKSLLGLVGWDIGNRGLRSICVGCWRCRVQ